MVGTALLYGPLKQRPQKILPALSREFSDVAYPTSVKGTFVGKIRRLEQSVVWDSETEAPKIMSPEPSKSSIIVNAISLNDTMVGDSHFFGSRESFAIMRFPDKNKWYYLTDLLQLFLPEGAKLTTANAISPDGTLIVTTRVLKGEGAKQVIAHVPNPKDSWELGSHFSS